MISGVETITTADTADEDITVSGILTAGVYDLGAGNDTLTLTNNSTVTVTAPRVR